MIDDDSCLSIEEKAVARGIIETAVDVEGMYATVLLRLGPGS